MLEIFLGSSYKNLEHMGTTLQVNQTFGVPVKSLQAVLWKKGNASMIVFFFGILYFFFFL